MKRARSAVGVLAAAAAALAAATLALPAGAAPSAAVTVYDATAFPHPGNLPSVGAEAYSFAEFGDALTLAGTARTLNNVVVTLSSWACQNGTWNADNCTTTPGATFSVPITLNVYSAAMSGDNGTVVPGGLIVSDTVTFAIPYRPTANLQRCNSSDGALGEWYDRASDSCLNGKAVNITFNLKPLRETLTDNVVIGISYDTTHYGPNPIGESAACYGTSAGCPYDSLNIALNDGTAPTVGTETYPGAVFQNAAFASEYCDATPVVGEFNEDSPTNACWAGYVPAIKVVAH